MCKFLSSCVPLIFYLWFKIWSHVISSMAISVAERLFIWRFLFVLCGLMTRTKTKKRWCCCPPRSLVFLDHSQPRLGSKHTIYDAMSWVRTPTWPGDVGKYGLKCLIRIKVRFFLLWHVDHFLVWGLFRFITKKEPNSGNYRHIFSQDIVPRKYMPIITAVGLFCCDKFEETSNEKVSNMSKLTKSYCNWANSQKFSNQMGLCDKFCSKIFHFYYNKK